jgi:hypothetical protein
VFRKPENYEAFERIIAEGLERYPVSLFAYQLLPNHWHTVLRPNAPDYRQPSAPEAGQEGEESKTTSPDPLNLSLPSMNSSDTAFHTLFTPEWRVPLQHTPPEASNLLLC